ncbi:ATP-binding cassette domain-containing protein [Corynebacterium sp. HMSC068G04]|uniref:ATP-binding cassette domain-containing protein n=1 Tax=Corynebacterium sp. HMSC068G04 TaxID=1739497 RepID=UPI0008A207E0|nr:ATP-binding cassette domain-containing protein [Corynebacterium sp. HMSC068G04]OFP30164.1 ABC transporter [Corynebacterium sp. HMSC068G04]
MSPTFLREQRPRTTWPVIAAGTLAAIYILAPVLALGLRVPWGQLSDTLNAPTTHDLLRVSLSAAVLSTLLSTFLGTCLALWLQQLRRVSHLVRLVVYLPLAMPPVVGGLALTALLGRRGLLGPVLEQAGLHISFAFPGVVAAHLFVTLPFVVVAVDSALRQLDPEVVASARGVGLSPSTILRHIILPAILPAVFTGGALAFARSLGEFGTTITFAGSLPGSTRTMPSGIYLEREVSADKAYALSAVLIGIAILTLTAAGMPLLLRRRREQAVRALQPMDPNALRAATAPLTPPHDLSVTVGDTTTTFRGGRVTAVVGPNGAGKTTLMRFTSGRLQGAQTNTERVIMLSQNPGLPPTATVAQALTMVTNDPRRTEELLKAAGLQELVHVSELSGGQAAQVALLRALAARPEVLVADEPFAAMDVESAARWRHLLRISAADRTTVIVTHSCVDLTTLADDVAVMEAGEVTSQGPADRLLEQPTTRFMAELAGVNVLRGSIRGDAFAPDRDGEHWAAFPQTALHFDPTGAQHATSLSATIVADLGSTTLVDIDGQRVTVGQPARKTAPGQVVPVALDASALTVYTRT